MRHQEKQDPDQRFTGQAILRYNGGSTTAIEGVTAVPAATVRVHHSISPTGNIRSGIALANPNDSTVVIRATLVTDGGARVGTTTIPLDARGHLSLFAGESQLFEAELASQTPFDGTLELTSTLPFAVLGIGTKSSGQGFEFFSTPASPPRYFTAPTAQAAVFLPSDFPGNYAAVATEARGLIESACQALSLELARAGKLDGTCNTFARDPSGRIGVDVMIGPNTRDYYERASTMMLSFDVSAIAAGYASRGITRVWVVYPSIRAPGSWVEAMVGSSGVWASSFSGPYLSSWDDLKPDRISQVPTKSSDCARWTESLHVHAMAARVAAWSMGVPSALAPNLMEDYPNVFENLMDARRTKGYGWVKDNLVQNIPSQSVCGDLTNSVLSNKEMDQLR